MNRSASPPAPPSLHRTTASRPNNNSSINPRFNPSKITDRPNIASKILRDREQQCRNKIPPSPQRKNQLQNQQQQQQSRRLHSRSPSPSNSRQQRYPPTTNNNRRSLEGSYGTLLFKPENPRQEHLEITMEVSAEGEEVELVADDGNGVVVSFMSAAESAADAEQQRQRIKKEWTVGTTRANIIEDDDEECNSQASIPTEVRSKMLKEAAARAVALLYSPEELSENEKALRLLKNEPIDAQNNNNTIIPTGCSATTTDPNQQNRIMDQLRQKMIRPTRQLADLLEAINLRGKWTRRKNACGALKVMTTKKNNRVTIAWTYGVLNAITTVLAESSGSGGDFSTVSEKLAYKEARSRIVAALLNLCLPLDNRIVIMHTPGLAASMAQVIKDDRCESRQGVCACLAHLAKTPENRVFMLQVPDLVHTLTGVISVTADFDDDKSGLGVDDDDDESDDSSSSSDGGHSCAIVSMDESSLGESRGVGDSFDTDADGDQSVAAGSVEVHIIDKPKLDKKKKISEEEEKLDPYDRTGNHFLNGARVNTFATLLHLAKNKKNAYYLGRDVALVSTLVEVSNKFNSPSHSRCVTILAHLTRLPENTQRMVFRVKNLVPTLVRGCVSRDNECRKYACFALQNLSYDKTCRTELAITPNLLKALCTCCMRTGYADEQLAAVGTLRNLSDEPANLIQMSNTHDCFATLMLMAHKNDDGFDEMMQYIACDTLAHLSHWLMKISTSGNMISNGTAGGGQGGGQGSGQGGVKGYHDHTPHQQQGSNMKFLTPSHQTSDWMQWR